MKVEIISENSLNDEDEDEEVLSISDDGLDNDNFVTLSFGGKEKDFALSELLPALIAFDAKRSRRLSEECND